MHTRSHILYILLSFFFLGCPSDLVTSETTGYIRQYDSEEGGIQIVEVLHRESENLKTYGWEDEVTVLETDSPRSLKGYLLFYGDGECWQLHDSIHSRLYVFTQKTHGLWSEEYALGLNQWVLEDVGYDGVRLLNSDSVEVSELSYGWE